MKKSFMTRVLATGLSLAMAFSLSAATNVTTAAAATSPMESTKITVTEGKTSSWVYLKNRGNSKYRIKSYKRTETAKKFITAKVGTKKRAVKVTAKKDAVTNAGLKQKQVAMTINLVKKADANKKNAKVVKTAKLYVVVKAKPVEKITMTAAATAVKEITLTFSGAVKDTTAAKIVVKKGNTTPTFTATWADDAKSAVLAMDSKMTKGTYDITVSGVETEDLVASVTVEDQKLTSFELVSANLVADATLSTKASISYVALDQYKQKMSGVAPTVTTSFGGTATPAMSKASEATKITVENMTSALCLPGTKGVITIVDNSGVSLTADITYVSPAKATAVELVGVLNNNGKLVDALKAGDNAGNDYKILLKFKDQYDQYMAYNDSTFTNIESTLAAGTTGLTSITASTVNYDDKDYYCLDMTGTLKAGTFQVTVVNKTHGLLSNLSFDVAPGTVIKSFTLAADADIYANEEATLSYTAIDADGNEVKDFDTLKKAFGGTTLFTAQGGAANGEVTLKKQSDGTGKIVYKQTNDVANKNTTTKRGSDSKVLTVQLYSGTANILVVNASIKVNEKRYFWEVTGVNSDKAVAGVKDTHLDFKAEDFKISDQYGNTLSKDNIKSLLDAGQTAVSTSAIENKSNWSVTPKKLTAKTTTFGAIVSNSGIVKIKVFSADNDKDNGYELTLSQANADNASTFEVKWNDSVSTFYTSKAGITASGIKSKFKVVGKVGGKTVTIPDTNYEVTAVTNGDKLGDPNAVGNSEKTVEGTITVTVTTKDDKGNYVSTDVTATFTSSNKARTLASIKKSDSPNVATGAANKVEIADMLGGFELKDQYGDVLSTADVSATVAVLTGDGKVKYNGTNKCVVEGVDAGDKLSITLTKGDLTASLEIEVTNS